MLSIECGELETGERPGKVSPAMHFAGHTERKGAETGTNEGSRRESFAARRDSRVLIVEEEE